WLAAPPIRPPASAPKIVPGRAMAAMAMGFKPAWPKKGAPGGRPMGRPRRGRRAIVEIAMADATIPAVAVVIAVLVILAVIAVRIVTGRHRLRLRHNGANRQNR